MILQSIVFALLVGFAHESVNKNKIRNLSYAATTALSSISMSTLEVKNITLARSEVGRTGTLMLTKGRFVHLNVSQNATEDIQKRTLNNVTKRIENASGKETEEIFESIPDEIYIFVKN